MKWADGDDKEYSPQDLYVFPDDGTVCLDTKQHNCVGWDEIGHEPQCGMEYLGRMDSEYSETDPVMLWSMAWDFTQI